MNNPSGQILGRFLRLLLCAGLLAAAAVGNASAAANDSAKSAAMVAKTGPAANPTVAPEGGENKIETLMAIRQIPAITKKFETRYNYAAYFVFLAFLFWILAVVGYLFWAIHFYVHNYGLTNHEWKVLNPAVYTDNPEELKKYQDIHARMNTGSGTEGATGEDVVPATSTAGTKPAPAPEANPYEGESFGLPPGTIRGILALSAMIAFLLIEALNIFAPTNLEGDFKELVTVFEMVIAFYFGSKAVDVFNKRAEIVSRDKVIVKVLDETPANPASMATAIIKGSGAGAETPSQASVTASLTGLAIPPPTELPALPASQAVTRRANLLENYEVAVPENKDTDPPKPALVNAPLVNTKLATRVLAMTASFETGKGFPDCFAGLSGNFDGQGMSFGALQWCLGQNSLQPLLKAMLTQNPAEAETALGGSARLITLQETLALPLDQQLAWARSIQFTQRNSAGKRVLVIEAQWRSALVALGKTDGMIKLQTEQAGVRYQKALANCKEYGCITERAVALFFDINVQNGRVDLAGTRGKILADVAKLSTDLEVLAKEAEILRIVAQRRSEASNPQWREDVLSRKMAIATGAGTVHSKSYDIEKQYGIRLVKALDVA